MAGPRPTLAVRLTPAGRGAVATILVEGPQALTVVEGLFHSASWRGMGEQPPNKILFGRWQSAETGEELVVCRRDSEQIEIHCHGGEAAVEAIIASLAEQGCGEICWPDWVRSRASDPIAAAAQILLAQATTRRTAAILWDQAKGALSRALDQIGQAIDAKSLSENRLGEGDSPILLPWHRKIGTVPAGSRISSKDTVAANRAIEELLSWSAAGSHLIEPWKVVLAGPPNVGKSSLINALVGYERAIVHATAGTTRDVVTATTALDGWPIELADTAGVRESDDTLEAAGVELARQRLAGADLVILVRDATIDECNVEDSIVQGKPHVIRVVNKCDLVSAERLDAWNEEYIRTSAVRGDGVDALQGAICQRLVSVPPIPGQAMPFTLKQVELLKQLQADVEAGRFDDATRLLAARASWA